MSSEYGAKPTVLLIHGNSADHTVFRFQVGALREAGFGVVTFDLPGHGRSDKARAPRETYSFPGYADAARQIIDDLGLEAVHVAGWSLGGHVGLELMGADSRVRSLFIWGTPPAKPGPDALRDAFIASSEMTYAVQSDLTPAEQGAYARAMGGALAEPLVEDLTAAIGRTDGEARAWLYRNGVSGVGLDARSLVEEDPRPLAVLHGEHDPFVQADYLDRIAYRALWRGRVQRLPSVGHAAHLQAPETFNALLLSFLMSSP